MRQRMKVLFQDPPPGIRYRASKKEHWKHMIRTDQMVREMFILEQITHINKIFKELIDMSYKDTFEEWLSGRPEVVQALAKKFPPGKYVMKEGSPYAITNPGTEVELYSWLETGDVGIIVKAEDKSEDALEHERRLGAKYNKTEEEMKTIHNSGIRAHIDPEWLELVTSDLDVD